MLYLYMRHDSFYTDTTTHMCAVTHWNNIYICAMTHPYELLIHVSDSWHTYGYYINESPHT